MTYLLNLTQDIAFLCPTKSLVVLQVERSMIWAVGPPPFIAWADTSMLPSGDQPETNHCISWIEFPNYSRYWIL